MDKILNNLINLPFEKDMAFKNTFLRFLWNFKKESISTVRVDDLQKQFQDFYAKKPANQIRNKVILFFEYSA